MGKRLIIAGGGTGGHIFPAIAIANAIKKLDDRVEVLFIGAKGKMEMEKVPQAGYKIEGLNIAGFNRSSLIKNIGLPYKLLRSFLQVRTIFRKFRPDAAIGVGGYSSFPVLRFAQATGVRTFIHESNSFAGRSNILLGRKATKIFTGTDGMEKFFPPGKTLVTGNPVRETIVVQPGKQEASEFFSLDPGKQTLLVMGGSLGAKSINEAIAIGFPKLLDAGLQVIWQTGKHFSAKAKSITGDKKGVWVNDFITKVDFAYAAADIVIARSGAMTVAELCLVKKPVLFVPYPFAAEDHQTVNAMRLVRKNAALMVKDNNAATELVPAILELAADKKKQEEMKTNIEQLAFRNADMKIAEEILASLKS